MFKNLTNFGYKRSTKEALGFYLAFLLLGLILGAIAGGLSGVLLNKGDTFESGFQAGARGGIIAAMLYPPVINFLILVKKGLTNNFGYILLAVLSAILGYLGGAILGLIPAAYLTTKDSLTK